MRAARKLLRVPLRVGVLAYCLRYHRRTALVNKTLQIRRVCGRSRFFSFFLSLSECSMQE